MSIWDSIKDWFTKDEYDKEEAKRKEEELLRQLGESQSKEDKAKEDAYNKGLELAKPVDKDFEYLEAEVDTDDAIKEKADSEYNDLWKNEQDALDKVYNDDKKKTEDSAIDANEKALENQEKVKKDYVENSEGFKNKAQKNGLVESSIMSEVQDDLADNKIEMANKITAELQASLADIDEKIEMLEIEKDLKKNRVDSDFKKKIDSKINALKADRNKELEKIDKHNSKVKQDEKEYKKEQDQSIEKFKNEYNLSQQEIEKHELINGYSGEKKKDYDARLEKTVGFYKQLPKKDAKEMISNNPGLRKYLGNYYGRLLREFN